MKLMAAMATVVCALASVSAHGGEPAAVSVSKNDSQTITITRSGSQASRQGPSQNFTGSVRVQPLFQPKGAARTSGSSVTFEPGARTAWHSHPVGQTLIVTAGIGRVQRWGGPIEEIRPGDVVCGQDRDVATLLTL